MKIEYVQGRPGDFSGKEVSSELAKRELKWSPKVNLEEGIRRYIVWYKERDKRCRNDWGKLDKKLKG